MTNELVALNARIESAERIAIGKAMCGQFSKADDQALAALYDERYRLYDERGNDDE